MTSSPDASTTRSTSFEALGTTAYVAATTGLDAAVRAVVAEVEEIDHACSRFRADSDLARVNDNPGRWIDVDRPLIRALRVALDAAEESDGAVDPTVGGAVRVLGYDRDFSAVPRSGPPIMTVAKVPGWQVVDIDTARCRVRVPPGVRLDLGATAKGLAADLAADSAVRACGGGVLVSLGGDIAVAGEAPCGGWIVGVADSHRTAFCDADQAVLMWRGGLATSSVTARAWTRGGVTVHHIVDPQTGAAAIGPWRTVTVAASTCLDANVSSTAAIARGDRAAAWLVQRGHPSRLVAADGAVLRLNGWPEDGE